MLTPGMVRSSSAKFAEGAVSIACDVITLIVGTASIIFCSPFVPVTTTVSSYLGGSSGFCVAAGGVAGVGGVWAGGWVAGGCVCTRGAACARPHNAIPTTMATTTRHTEIIGTPQELSGARVYHSAEKTVNIGQPAAPSSTPGTLAPLPCPPTPSPTRRAHRDGRPNPTG